MKKKINIRSIKINVILNVLYTLMNAIFPLITYPYVSRVLSAVGIGRVNFFSQIANYCTMLAALGIGTYGIRAVARTRFDHEKLSKVVKELLYINIFLTFIVMLLYLIIAIILPQFRSNLPLVLINAIAIATAPFSLDWMYSGLEQYSYITKRDFIFKIISIIAIFLFVKTKSNYAIYAFILMGANLGTTICNFLYAREIINFSAKGRLNYKQHIKPMLTLFASIFAINVYFSLDTIMLGFIRGDRQVGLYTTAVKVENVLLSVVNAISIALLPRLSAYIQEKKYTEFNAILKKSISIIMAINLSLCIFFIITAHECVLILGGNSFSDATLSMQLLMPILVISGFSNITGNQILIPKEEEKYYTFAVSIGAVMDIIINCFLMKPFGATGASLATLLAECTQMSIQLYFCRKEIKRNINFRSLLKIVVSVIVATIALFAIRHYILDIPLLINMVIQAVVFFGVVLLALLILKEENIVEIVTELIHRNGLKIK